MWFMRLCVFYLNFNWFGCCQLYLVLIFFFNMFFFVKFKLKGYFLVIMSYLISLKVKQRSCIEFKKILIEVLKYIMDMKSK